MKIELESELFDGQGIKITGEQIGGLLKCFNAAKDALNKSYEKWHIWHQTNPDSVDELAHIRTAADLGIKKQDNVRFGIFMNTEEVFKSVGNIRLPTSTSTQENEAYRKNTEREKLTTDLRQKVGNIDPKKKPNISTFAPKSSLSKGIESIKKILSSSGDLICTRVVSDKEAEKVKTEKGKLIPKLSGAKWFSIGKQANIVSSGNISHNNTIQWTVKADFRHVLLLGDMNNYNESEISKNQFKEPYWTWKDNEPDNISLSPVVTNIFNDMIISVTVNKEKIK